jgi:hypothetical protein
MNEHNFHASVAPDTTAQSASGVTTPDILAEEKEQQQDYQGIEDDGKSAQAEDPNDVKEEYPSGLMLVPILIAILCAVFLTALDMTIIGTAIPKITDEFEGLNMVSWVSQTPSH